MSQEFAANQNERTAAETAATSESEIVTNASLVGDFVAKQNPTSTALNHEPVLFNAVFDVGATETRRLMLFDGAPVNSKDIIHVPSEYAIISTDEDYGIYNRTSDRIEDNAEFIVHEVTTGVTKTSWFEKPTRILKHNLISRMKKAPSTINNQGDKSEDIGFYINILTELAVVALFNRRTKVQAKVSFILPAKERYSSQERLEEIKNTIGGLYKIEMPRYQFSCEIAINPADVAIEAEGEVAYIYYVTTGKDAAQRFADLHDKRVVAADLGGSTFNLSLIENGKIVSSVSQTAKFGGENLVNQLHLQLGRRFKEPMSAEKAREGVRTGAVLIGSELRPVGEILTKTKEEFVERMYAEVVNFLRTASIYGSDVYAYMFLGRGMMQTGRVDGEGKPTGPDFSPSMAHMLMAKLAQISPTSKSIIMPRPGVANLLGLAMLMRVTWKLN